MGHWMPNSPSRRGSDCCSHPVSFLFHRRGKFPVTFKNGGFLAQMFEVMGEQDNLIDSCTHRSTRR